MAASAALATAEAQALPVFNGPVVDQTATLKPSQQAALAHKLQAFAARHGPQLAVWLVASTQGEPIAQYALRVAEQWRLGRRGVDDGVLLILATQDHAARIEVGYGLEGAMSDLQSRRILHETLLPHLRQGDIYAGVAVALDQIMQVLDAEALPAPQLPVLPDGEERMFTPFLLILMLAVGTALRHTLGRSLGALLLASLVGMLCWVVLGRWLDSMLWSMAAMAFAWTCRVPGPVVRAGRRPGAGAACLGASVGEGLTAGAGPPGLNEDPGGFAGGGSFGGAGASAYWTSASAGDIDEAAGGVGGLF